MTPRLKRIRKVLNPPVIKGFKPYGPDSGDQRPEPVYLLYEEYEALRLCDYDSCNHHHASIIMGISRSTYTRIYASAREKIASAFVEGRQIIIEGGKVYFDSDWYNCKQCQCYFNHPERVTKVMDCPLCGSQQIDVFEFDELYEETDPKRCKDYCICPSCGFEVEHEYGKPCRLLICPRCTTFMKRKEITNYRTSKSG